MEILTLEVFEYFGERRAETFEDNPTPPKKVLVSSTFAICSKGSKAHVDVVPTVAQQKMGSRPAARSL